MLFFPWMLYHQKRSRR